LIKKLVEMGGEEMFAMVTAKRMPVKIRRWDASPFIIGGILITGSVAAPLYNHDLPFEGTGLFYSVALLILAVMYVDGPAAYVAVGPAHVVVGNWLWKYRVPRARVADVSTLEYLDLFLVLDDGQKVRLRVFEPAISASTYRSPRHSAGRARAITDAVTTAPMVDDGTRTVTRRLRWINTALLCVPFAAAATIVIASRA
jgi:hypothetical protein